MRPLRLVPLAALAALAALPLVAAPAAAHHSVDVCVPTSWDHGPVWSCVATASVPHAPSVPPICFWDYSTWPPQRLCLS